MEGGNQNLGKIIGQYSQPQFHLSMHEAFSSESV
jgi:hypothetical protein